MAYCSGKHESEVVERESPHPAVVMSKTRADAWRKFASDEDFYKHLEDLSVIYARRHYTGNGNIDQTALFVDYKRWRDDGWGGTIKESSPHKS